jgi:hypothetical protein
MAQNRDAGSLSAEAKTKRLSCSKYIFCQAAGNVANRLRDCVHVAEPAPAKGPAGRGAHKASIDLGRVQPIYFTRGGLYTV